MIITSRHSAEGSSTKFRPEHDSSDLRTKVTVCPKVQSLTEMLLLMKVGPAVLTVTKPVLHLSFFVFCILIHVGTAWRRI